MTEKRRICLITAGLEVGGMERSLTNLANYFAEIGHEVILISLYNTETCFELHKKIVVIWPSNKTGPPKLNRKFQEKAFSLFQSFHFVRSSIKQIEPDFLICFGEWFNPFIIITTRFLNVNLFL